MKKQLKIVGNITSYSKENGRVFSDESLAPSLDCQAVHGHSPRIVVDGGVVK